MDRLVKTLLLGFTVGIAAGLTGCGSLETPRFKLPFLGDKEDGKPDMKDVLPPQKMVSLWSNTVYTAPGKPATRGLAARVYFYDANRKTVPVEGSLIVYGYDDSKSTGTNRQPDRKYVFKPEQLASHYSVSDFGPSYSIWIPWDQVGQNQKDVSLVPVFTDKDGKSLMGEHTQHVLPGPSTVVTSRSQSLGPHELLPSSPPASPSNEVRLATFDANGDTLPGSNVGTPGGTALTNQLRATSIKLPPAVRDRLAQSTEVALPQPSGWQTSTAARVWAPSMPTPSIPSSSVPTTTGTRQPVTRSPARTPAVGSFVGEQPYFVDPTGQTSPPPSLSSALSRIRSKTSLQQRLPSAHFAPATHPVPTSPMPQPTPLPLGTQPSPSGWPSVPAWPPGQPSGN